MIFESENQNGLMKGFSSNYVRVSHPYDAAFVNKITGVKAGDFDGETCSAEISGGKKSVDLIAC